MTDHNRRETFDLDKRDLIQGVREIDPELVAAAEWILRLTDSETPAPGDGELERLFDALQKLRLPWLMQLGEAALTATPQGARVVARKQLDQLLESKHWRYPFRVLQRPLLDEMVAVCDERLADAGEAMARRLGEIREALAGGTEIRERAQKHLHRLSMRRGSGRPRPRPKPEPDD